MVSADFRPSALTLLLAATVVLSGCSVAVGPLDDDAEAAVADQVEQRMNEIDGFTATQTTDVTFDGETHSSRADVWIRPHTGQSRSEMLAPADQAGDVTVAGNETTWYYDASESVATRTNVTRPESTDTGIGVQLSALLDEREVVYDGEVELDGQSVWKVRLLPGNETDGQYASNVTMWVDTEQRFPVKIRHTTSGDVNVTSTVRFENVSINPGIEDSRFTFDPPANATIEQRSVDVRTFDTRAELAAATNASVPDPDLPDGFGFESASMIDESFSMQYSNGSATLVVTRTADASGNASDRGETVAVGDREGRYVSFGETGTVRWSCDDAGLSVAGELDRETLLDTARSIGCP